MIRAATEAIPETIGIERKKDLRPLMNIQEGFPVATSEVSFTKTRQEKIFFFLVG